MIETPFCNRPYHRDWLLEQAGDLFSFFARHSSNPAGGFNFLSGDGTPLDQTSRGTGPERELFATCRMIHCYAAADLLGHPGAAEIVDHGIRYLSEGHADPENGGWFWGRDDAGVTRDEKLAYGHAFVLLAAASAGEAGHPHARALHDKAFDVILTRFWDDDAGAMKEEFTADWSPLSDYRGQNSNMHTTEALMAAYEAWDEPRALEMAERISDMIINRHARDAGWVVPEHFDEAWVADREYDGDPMFRPAGTTPGHALEWARLLIQLWHLGGKRHDWMPEAAQALFRNAVAMSWDEDRGGFHYTLDWQGAPAMKNRFWWPLCEAAGAAAVLRAATGDPFYETWYRRIWTVLERDFIDHDSGGWWAEAGADGKPVETVFRGKPDIYHALQACLIPLLPADRGLLSGIKAVKGDLRNPT
ncbi:AGE family epimerase/isomerase [Celeribacter arenosi]|uniref:AGE family epimerase/isomerase n=1 Tax=Celeribacter arenosi TaxID=792649 RepID=A0ABP7K5D2_9RHOB